MPPASPSYDAPDSLRAPGRRRHSAQPVRPADPSCRPLRGRHWRAQAPSGRRHGDRGRVHVRDGRARLRDRRARPARRPGALDRDRDTVRVRGHPPRASAGGPSGSVHQSRCPGPQALEGRGLLARLPPRNEPWPRLRALRGADPGGRDHGLGLAGLHRRQARRGLRVRHRLRRGPLRADAGWAKAHRRHGRLENQGPGRDGRADGADSRCDVGRARHPLPDGNRG